MKAMGQSISQSSKLLGISIKNLRPNDIINYFSPATQNHPTLQNIAFSFVNFESNKKLPLIPSQMQNLRQLSLYQSSSLHTQTTLIPLPSGFQYGPFLTSIALSNLPLAKKTNIALCSLLAENNTITKFKLENCVIQFNHGPKIRKALCQALTSNTTVTVVKVISRWIQDPPITFPSNSSTPEIHPLSMLKVLELNTTLKTMKLFCNYWPQNSANILREILANRQTPIKLSPLPFTPVPHHANL
jgi:hypothetical protein